MSSSRIGAGLSAQDESLYDSPDEASTFQPTRDVAADPNRVKRIMSRARFGRRSLGPGEVSALQKKRMDDMKRRSGDDPATRNLRVADRFSEDAASTGMLMTFADMVEPGMGGYVLGEHRDPMIRARVEHIHRRTSGALNKAAVMRRELQQAGVQPRGLAAQPVPQFAPSTRNQYEHPLPEAPPFVHEAERRSEWINTAHDLLQHKSEVLEGRERAQEAERLAKLAKLEQSVGGYTQKSSYQMMQQRRARSDLGQYPDQTELAAVSNTMFSPPRRGVRSPQPRGAKPAAAPRAAARLPEVSDPQGSYDPEVYLQKLSRSNDPGHARRWAQLDSVAVGGRSKRRALGTSQEMADLDSRSKRIDARLAGRTRLVG